MKKDWANDKMKKIFTFKKELYSKEALLKSAYRYVDDFYIHLDDNQLDYIVEIEPKKEYVELNIEEFKNEMLIQETRKIVADKTHNLREMIFARAMASTIIIENDDMELVEDNDVDDILVNWFDKYEE